MTKNNNVIVFPNARQLPQQHPFCWNVRRIRRFVLLFSVALNINPYRTNVENRVSS